MKAKLAVGSILLALVVLAGCGGSPTRVLTGTNSGPIVSFSSRVIRPGSSEPTPDFEIKGGVGEVTLQGAVGTDLACFTVSGTAVVSGNDLTFTVLAAQTEACASPVDTVAYDGRVSNLSPRPLHVFLVHDLPTSVDTVLTADVTVQ